MFRKQAKYLKLINLCCLFVGWIKDNLFKIKSVVAKTSVNIWLVLGIVLCFLAPIFIHSITGLNLYETYSFNDSFSYIEFCAADVAEPKGTPLFHIRSCLATILFNLIVLFCLINYNKLTGSLAKKAIMGATLVKVCGGFEGLGETDLDAQHETPKATRRLNSSLNPTALEVERNSLSMSATQMEYQRQMEISKVTIKEVNPEGKAVPIPIQTGISSSSRFMDFKYVMGLGNPCPWKISPIPPFEFPNLPGSSSEPAPSSTSEAEDKVKITKTVRFQTEDVLRKEANIESMVESDKQVKYNSDSSGSNTFNYSSGNKQDHTKVETSFKTFKTKLANANEN